MPASAKRSVGWIDGAVVDGLGRRSSSARAKYALACLRISFAWRNSRFARSRFLTRPRIGGQSSALPLVALGLIHPQAQRLPVAADLLGDRADRRRGVLGFLLPYQANRALAQLRRARLR